jgi:hypothetical protein
VEDTKITLTLELEPTDDTFNGRAIDSAGAERRFSGWIGLVGVIDQLLGGRQSAADEDD